MSDDVVGARATLMDAITSLDDKLAEKFIMEQPISEAEILAALRSGTIASKIVPVVCGASFKNIGVQPLLDAVIAFLPSPLDLPAVKGHDVNNLDTILERKPADDEPFAALAFKIASDSFSGTIAFLRVSSLCLVLIIIVHTISGKSYMGDGSDRLITAL